MADPSADVGVAVLAGLLVYPRTWAMLVYGNPSMWAFAALVAGLVWTWPAAWALLKPTRGPFVLLGIHRRAWWIGAEVALATAITRFLRDHSSADLVGRAGHDTVYDRFCIQLMVDAIEAIYDEGARAVRLSPLEVAAAV